MVGKTNAMKYFRNILLSPTCDRDILEREAASENQKYDYVKSTNIGSAAFPQRRLPFQKHKKQINNSFSSYNNNLI